MNLKPFHAIPGPKSWPLIGCLHEYSITKKYNFLKLHKNGLKKYLEYGPIVKEEIVPGVNILWIFDCADIKAMFAAEGRYPSRRSHLALNKYRKDRPNLYNNGGLLPTNGPEWARLRGWQSFSNSDLIFWHPEKMFCLSQVTPRSHLQ